MVHTSSYISGGNADEFVDDDDDFVDAPEGDDTGDLSSKDRAELLKEDDVSMK